MLLKEKTTIRFQLASLVLACVLPVWLMAAVLVYQEYCAKVREVKEDMQDAALSLARAVDRQLSTVQAALEGVATSPSVKSGDFRAVHLQARQLLTSYPGADIIVADATGQQMVNSFRPFGAPLPKRNNPLIVREIFASGKPAISNLFFGAVTRRPLIAVDVPVLEEGRVIYDLSMTFPSDTMRSILSHQNLPKGWSASIMDRYRVTVASTRAGDSAGKEASSLLSRELATAPHGTMEGADVAGRRTLLAFSRSPISGWTVVVEVPKAAVMTEIYRWMGWAIGGASLISLIGILLALRIGHRIALSIRSLVPPALSIGREEAVTEIPFQDMRETAEVGAALLQASELLQSHKETVQLYTRRLIEMEEELRKRIAAELHDDVGQELTVLALNLSLVNASLPAEAGGELRSRIVDASMLTKGINRRVRDLMTELSPPQIEEFGLAAALRLHAELYASRTGIAVDVQADDGTPRLSLQQEIALFRIVQEALINVAKHAAATDVEVSFSGEGKRFQLQVRDNGKGFVTEGTPSGWGLTIMRERAAGIGGLLSVASAPAAGTTVIVSLGGEDRGAR